jgi:hypothetical protein
LTTTEPKDGATMSSAIDSDEEADARPAAEPSIHARRVASVQAISHAAEVIRYEQDQLRRVLGVSTTQLDRAFGYPRIVGFISAVIERSSTVKLAETAFNNAQQNPKRAAGDLRTGDDIFVERWDEWATVESTRVDAHGWVHVKFLDGREFAWRPEHKLPHSETGFRRPR